MWKRHIMTSVWCAQHPDAGQNIQQEGEVDDHSMLCSLPRRMKEAKMTVDSLMPKTLSMKYPPMIGKTTLGQEYQAYKFSNWYVVIFIVDFISFWNIRYEIIKHAFRARVSNMIKDPYQAHFHPGDIFSKIYLLSEPHHHPHQNFHQYISVVTCSLLNLFTKFLLFSTYYPCFVELKFWHSYLLPKL